MTRYARLYASFLRFSFSRAMEFRFDFFFRIGMDVLWYIMHFVFFEVMYRHTDMLGGWTHDQILVFQCAVYFVDAVYMAVLSSNMWWFPFLVNRGDLDYYLVRPVSSLFFLSLQEFAANSFLNVLITMGLLAFVLVGNPAVPDGGRVVLFVVLLLAGVFLQWALMLLAMIPVFWLHQGQGVRQLGFALSRLSHRPDGIYRGWVRRLVIWIVPFAITASFPCRALFSDDPWTPALHMAGACVVFYLLVLGAWRLGLRAYASASS